MFAVYELLDVLPSRFVPPFAPRYSKLCTFLMENERMTEQEAAKQFLQTSGREKYFNTLKNELKRELIRYLMANPSWSTKKHKVLIEDCYRNFAAYKILLTLGKRKTAIELATPLLSKLRSIDTYPLAYIVARDLRAHYASSDPSPSLVKKYETIIAKYDAIIQAETLVHQYYDRVALICNTRDGFTKDHLAYFKEAAESTLPLTRLGSSTLNRFIYSMVIAHYHANREYNTALDYCEQALAGIPEDHPNIQSLRFSVLHRKVSVLLGLEKNIEAKEVAREVCEIFPTGTANWHIATIKRVIVCFHGGDYQEAYDLFKANCEQPCPYEPIAEYWQILRGYLYFLIQRGLVTPYEKERFSLGKFMNEMPMYQKDKAGQNINILLIQLLVQLERNQYWPVIDRIASLQEYIRSYTKNPETKRANLFISMIVKMSNAHFHRSGTELKTKKLRLELEQTPIKYGQNLAVEIVPYPILWKEILAMLENKFRAKGTSKSSKRIPSNTGGAEGE